MFRRERAMTDYLIHYGVKGMRWGVRKEKPGMNRRQFRTHFENERNDAIREYRNKRQNEIKKAQNTIDRLEKKYHDKNEGYEYGDLYDPDWKSWAKGRDTKKLSGEDKDYIDYNKSTDLLGEIEKSGSSYADKVLMKKYGAVKWKNAYRDNKQQIKRGEEIHKFIMNADPKDTSVTKKVKNDYNNLNEREFFAKYKATKRDYRKRVEKHGDPYRWRKNTKTYKALSRMVYGKKKNKDDEMTEYLMKN